jgi:hypothetical protein
MHGYAWVTGGGIYMILDGRWCKTTQFHDEGYVTAGWGDWEVATDWSVISQADPTPRAVAVSDVRPGDFPRIGGQNAWDLTTMARTVLGITTKPHADAIAQLRTPTAAWLAGEAGVVALGRDGQRIPALAAPDGDQVWTFYVLTERTVRPTFEQPTR